MIAIAQTVAQPFPLLQLTLKITLLLGLFFAFWLMFRKKSASFRHSILVVALLSIPCLLAAQWLIPSQNLQWLEQESVSNFERAFDYSPENSSANSNSSHKQKQSCWRIKILRPLPTRRRWNRLKTQAEPLRQVELLRQTVLLRQTELLRGRQTKRPTFPFFPLEKSCCWFGFSDSWL